MNLVQVSTYYEHHKPEVSLGIRIYLAGYHPGIFHSCEKYNFLGEMKWGINRTFFPRTRFFFSYSFFPLAAKIFFFCVFFLFFFVVISSIAKLSPMSQSGPVKPLTQPMRQVPSVLLQYLYRPAQFKLQFLEQPCPYVPRPQAATK